MNSWDVSWDPPKERIISRYPEFSFAASFPSSSWAGIATGPTLMAETFTDFMIRMMAGEDAVKQAVVIVNTDDGIGYFVWTPDSEHKKTALLGLMRFATLSVEHDLVESWKQD